MIGRIRSREAWIGFPVRDQNGRLHSVRAIVDTGSTAWLTLPRATIDSLGLKWVREGRGLLADNSVATFNVFDAVVIWNRRVRRIFVDESESIPLVGMSLLSGFELRIEVREGGKVSIRPLPTRRGRSH
jgi:clan AA aspartic protease